MFFGLSCLARIVLAALKALLAHLELVHPEDLVRVKASWSPVAGAQLPAEATGDALQDWASNIEDSVFELMDELGTADSGSTKGLAELDGLHWLADATFEFDGRSIDARPILLLDDLQYLSDVQHAYLNGALTALRKPLGIWAAERLEALQQKDLIAPGVLEGRDYDSVIRLEERWLKRGAGPLGRFLSQIANLRARQADGFGDRDFFPAILGEAQDIRLQRIFDKIQPDQICPVVPFPTREPRRGDRIVESHQRILFDEFNVEPRNILYASEYNPFEAYREVFMAIDRYRDALVELGDCRVFVSPLSSKLLSISALLACYDHKRQKTGKFDVGIPYVEVASYGASDGNLQAERMLTSMWLTGEWEAP